jgi:murein L,D-transpeptidase YcbB/YkuD
MSRCPWLPVLFIFAQAITPARTSAQSDPVADALQARIERLRETGTLQLLDTRVVSSVVLPEFYERRNFRPAWQDTVAVDDLLRAIRDAWNDGLDPGDYHLPTLERLRAEVDSAPRPPPELLADYDLLLSDALAGLGHDLRFGKVDPDSLGPAWNLLRGQGTRDPARMMQDAIDSGSPYSAIEELRPKHFVYTGLRAVLAKYRLLRKAGGWKPVPAGATLETGMTDWRVPLLRRRLSGIGDLNSALVDTSTVFDDSVSAALQRFQDRHGLAADGRLGPATRAALNVPVVARINQIKVNLERGRWILHDLDSAFLAVNAAAFRVYYIVGGRILWQARTVVGQPFRQTPVFRATLKYLVFNPTWTVPETILDEDILPELRRNPVKGLKRRGLKVIDRSGNEIDPRTIAWARYTSKNLPYTLRQDPGDNNTLGRVKFVLPNPYAVYLHDTPRKDLFTRPQRAFSSGCIRVENALELARLLLDDETRWSRAAIDSVVSTGETRTVSLTRPLPVLVLYWTAWVGADGRVNFRTDLYGRDARILRALNDPVGVSRQSLVGSPSP